MSQENLFGVMHDLRTPIHPILTSLDLAAEQPPGTEKRLQQLEQLFQVCKINIPIIESLIQRALEKRKKQNVKQRVDLRKTVSRAVALYALPDRKLMVCTNLGLEPALVEHDPLQMGRVLGNILKNSVEALELVYKKDRSWLACINVFILHTSSNEVTIRIEDSGPGLPEDTSSLWRGHQSSKPNGCGLGLIVSRQIVEAHGGRLIAGKSEALGGARFEVVLPLKNSGHT